MKFNDIVKIIGWDIINPIALKFKRNQKYKFSDKFQGINIGCGINNPSNWLGVDGGFTHYLIHKIPKSFYKAIFKKQKMASNYTFDEYYHLSKNINLVHHELLYGLPFENDSIPNVFTSHFLEHITLDVCRNLLMECHRVMVPGGVIRICVPSLIDSINEIEAAISNYKNNNSDDIQKFVTSNIFGFNSSYSNHRYMYDYNRMSSLLEECGFVNIVQCELNVGKIPDIDKLDTRGGLIVEAIK